MAKSRVVGLDIGTTHIRAAEIVSHGGGARLVSYGHVDLPLGAVRDGEVVETSTVVAALKQLWAQKRFSTKDVVIGVGNQRVIVRELELPSMPLPQLRASLPYQVQDLLPMATEDALLDYYPTHEFDGPNGRAVKGLFVAAVRDTVSANVRAVTRAGLNPVRVDLNAFALLRALTRGQFAETTVALVDIGARITNVVIANQGQPRFVRTLPSGGQDVTDAVGSVLGLGTAQAEQAKREIGVGFPVSEDRKEAAKSVATVTKVLVDAVCNTLAYYTSNNPFAPITMVVLTGGGSHLAGLGQYLSSASRLPVTLGDPLERIDTSQTNGGDLISGHVSSVALSVGLAYEVAA